MLASLSARLIATFTGGALKVKRVTSSDDGTVEDPEATPVAVTIPVAVMRMSPVVTTITMKVCSLRR